MVGPGSGRWGALGHAVEACGRRRARLRLALAAGLALWPAAPLAAQPTSITILHLGATRSHLAGTGPKDARLAGGVGGLARVATLVQLVRSVDENAVLLHAGDLVSGDLSWNAFQGVPELQLLRALGLDALAVGERELAFGPDALAELLASMNQGSETFTMLSANLDASACAGSPCAPLQQWIEPSRMLDVSGVRIGVFGLTTPDEPTLPPGAAKLLGKGDRDWLLARAFETAAALRAQGAQIVILLSHLDRGTEEAIAAKQPTGLVDLIVEGHGGAVLHEPIVVAGPEGHATRIVAAGEHYEHVGRLRLTVDGPQVTVDEYSLFTVGPWIEPDPAVAMMTAGLERRIVAEWGEDVYRRVLGRALRDVERRVDGSRQLRDTPLGNLVANAYRWKARAEIGLTANGYVGERLYRGPIVGADLFRVVGHGYDAVTRKSPPLVRLAVTGAALVKAIEGSLAYLGRSDSVFLQVSGLRYRYDSRRRAGERLVPGSLLVHGEPIDRDRLYSVATGTALAAVMAQVIGIEIESVSPLAATEYEALRDYVLRSRLLAPRSEGRILDVAGPPGP